ncbi:MAG: hypothetical protein H0X38_06360 [Planctomycetes bacterium]|nr:hypothetical protein [Planctomycetota bacterium]
MLSRLMLIALMFIGLENSSRAETYPVTIAPGDATATIAVGDSLAFTSAVSGTVYTYLNCGIYGKPFSITPGEQSIIPFHKPGHFLGIVKDGNGNDVASVAVTVVQALITRRADQVGFLRVADFHVLPDATQVTFQANDPNLLDVTEIGTTGDLAHLEIRAKARGDLRIQAVIQSPAGPRVIGEAPVDEFTIDTPSLREALIDASTGIGTTKLVMHPLVPNAIVTFSMFAHTSTFAGGSKTFTVSSNIFTKVFDPIAKETDGVYVFDIEMPAEEDRYCFTVDFSQANSPPVPIGSSGGINGSGCKVTVDPIVMCSASGGKDLVVTVTDNATTGGTKHVITIVGSAGVPKEAAFNENKKTTSTSMIDCNIKGDVLKLRVTPGTTGKIYDVQIEQTIFSQRITVVDIVFSKKEVRPGIPAKWHAKVTATVTPAGVTAFFTSSDPRATVLPASGTGSVDLTVGGVTLSGGNKDTRLQGRCVSASGDICIVMPVTVVEPTDYQETPTATDSSPALAADRPTVVEWKNDITITVKDQFTTVLQDNWDGLVIEENVRNAGWSPFLTPLAAGVVTDPVRAEADYHNAAVAASVVAGTTQAGSKVTPSMDPQLLRADVDGGVTKPLGPVNDRVNTFNGPASSYTTTNSH